MRKTIQFSSILMFICMLASCASVTGPAAPEEMRTYEEIIEFPGVNKDELYKRVNAWFVDTFKSAESVIEYSDKEAGTVMGKWTFSSRDGIYSCNVKSTISVDVKDGKARLLFKDPYFQLTGDALNGSAAYVNRPYYPQTKQASVENTREQWKVLATSFKQSVTASTDW